MSVSYAASCVWVIESKLFTIILFMMLKTLLVYENMYNFCVRRKKYSDNRLIVQIMILKLRLTVSV